MNRAARRYRGPVTPQHHTWHGRRGPVVLGPTEDRVARYLDRLTRQGRVTIRALDVAEATRVERSEVYRITRRLRTLGLFGIEDDRGGTRGGRRFWRTAIEHDGAELHPQRHRDAWARLVGWARSLARQLATTTAGQARPLARLATRPGPVRPDGAPPAVWPPGRSPTFRDMFAAAPGGAALLEAWGR